MIELSRIPNRPIAELVDLHVRSSLRPEERGNLANAILKQVYEQADLEVLRPMFESANLDDTKSLVFVLSEIGLRAVEAMQWLDALLDSPDEWVRHHAIVAVQHSGTCDHPDVVAHALRGLGDVRSVRLAAVRLVGHGSLVQIATATPLLKGKLQQAVEWLVEGRFDDAERWLSDPDLAVSLVGLAGAFRRATAESSPLIAANPDLADALRWLRRTVIPDNVARPGSGAGSNL
ncbi:MAG: hypothetical protein NTZ21_04710 [Actinobacteria bacterium]|nr:hypothetical protein [Actinomycetota bacterium]